MDLVRRLAGVMGTLACLLSALSPVQAQSVVDAAELAPQEGLRYALGGALIVAPSYAGGSGQQFKPRPLWAVRHGRFRISGARASGLLGVAGDGGSGASADLLDRPDWRLGASLRFDSGRSPGDDPVLDGLPAIRRTLRGRVYGQWHIAGGWNTSLGYSADLLGRGGGGIAGLALSYNWTPLPGLAASVSTGVNWADAQHMRTYFGIAPEVAQATGRTAYVPGSGVMDLHAGVGLRLPLRGRWTVFGSLGVSQLQGEAAASPLTRRSQGMTAMVALAWRSP
jgi:outer membrane scaffolding protein for murein synthesis (MipA/OmpV family)